ncbi:hypothetical protein GGR50DRAFT_533278 [Xylaria sp. CBS 124048]|nr:hypothetical protein GGR50DRAFT_533278 [Xylaria sp. CBS 124048]
MTSTISQVLPLLFLLLAITILGIVGFLVYQSATQIRQNAEDRFASRNIVVTKDGIKVGVRHIENERYVDATQSWVVRAYNAGTGAKTQAEGAKRRLWR